MGYDDESRNREDLLYRYNSLMRQANDKGRFFRLSRGYREILESYKRYNSFTSRDDKLYLRAANTTFSKKLSDFEKLVGGEK